MEKTEVNQYDRLRQVAASLFATRGYSATSIRELAGHMGMETSSLYHYISSKEQLLLDISRESLQDLMGEIEPIVSSDLAPLDKLTAVIRRHTVAILVNRDKHAAMLFELRFLSSRRRRSIIQLRDRYEALLARVLEEALFDGRLRTDIPPGYLKLALLNLLNWSIVWYRSDGPLTPEEWGDILARVFVEGCLAPGHR